MSKPRTRREPLLVVGGPNDGMRVSAYVNTKDEWVLQGGWIFFPEGLDDYDLDRENRTLTYVGARP